VGINFGQSPPQLTGAFLEIKLMDNRMDNSCLTISLFRDFIIGFNGGFAYALKGCLSAAL
jgi:hypothetical protein